MRWIYNVGIFLLRFGFFIGQLFNEKARQRWLLRNHWKKEIAPMHIDLWMHCASLGEFDQGLPVLWAFKRVNPDAKILVTFFSPSGLNHFNKRDHCVDIACLIPLDTKSNAANFLTHFSPKCALFVKYEFWFNFISEIHHNKIPLYSISTLLRKNHFVFSPLGSYFRSKLDYFDHFFVQNQDTEKLLHKIGITQTTFSGDTRYDQVLASKISLVDLEKNGLLFSLANLCKNKSVMIIGSSWLPEEEMLLEGIKELPIDKFILAPHDISDKHIFEIEAMFGDTCIRLSEWSNYNNEPVIIVDNIGLLNKIYVLGTIAFIGGGFSGNLHNILEPAVYDLPVIFGPNHHKFPEANAFIEAGIGFSVANPLEFKQKVKMIMADKDRFKNKSVSFIQANAGATLKISTALFNKP